MPKLIRLLVFLGTLFICVSCNNAGIDSDADPGSPDPVDVDSDGIDDSIDGCIDCDGDDYGEGVDCLGPDCDDFNSGRNPGQPESCDGIDNDCDDQIDEDFSVGLLCLSGESPCGSGLIECSGISDPPTVCSTAYGGSEFGSSILSAGDSISGTTDGRPNNCSEYASARWTWPGPDTVYAFSPEYDSAVTVNLSDLSVDLDLLLLESDCMGTSCGSISQQTGQTDESITFTSSSGTLYYFVVDSRNASQAGSFTISVSTH